MAAGPGLQGNGSPYALFGLIVGVIAIVIIAFVIESGWRRPGAEPSVLLRWIIIVLTAGLFAMIMAFAAHRDPTILYPAGEANLARSNASVCERWQTAVPQASPTRSRSARS